MDVVDKLDKLNNEYAVSAAGLGEGLERSASAMAMSGNTLEETLAMLTGAGEITQNLENTGNGIKILSLRLRGMKGALEELNEPVDDLMEVSKIQTQILNLTHNQVNIFDEATQEFRSTYDIMKDISDIWDSLSSTSRANLTEILFGKQRANIGLALIQAFQSGQVQSAFEDATNAAGTATEEYDKMMQGVQAQLDAFKGAFQEFSNAFINSDLLKGLVKFGTQFIQLLTTATDKVGGLVVVLTPLLMYFGAKTRTNIFTAIINGFKGLIAAEAGAITATGALSTAVKVLGGALSGLAIGAIIAGISYLADKLIVTTAETEESIREITSAVGDLANATEELEKSQADIESIAQNYSKIATTVGDVNERKTQLLELQGQLTDKFKEEANGIDLVNGKYSDQIRQLQKLEEEQRKQYELENADKIARARRLANLRVDDIYEAQASAAENGYVRYSRDDDKKGERALFTIRDIDERVARLTTAIDGAYASLQGTFDAKGIYLSGTLEDARNQLKQIIDNYSKLSDVDSETLSKLTQRYKELNDALNEIKEVAPYIENIETKPLFTGMFDGFADAVNQFASDVSMQPFYDKLDEAQEKLRQLATPDGLTISEYDTLYHDVQNLERELYKMAGDSESSKQKVSDLFGAFKQGVAENGDNLEKFVEQFNTTLEESFKEVSEVVTGVQDALSKLAEGKGLSHSEAWKLLKADTDGYLQSIKLVNGEYYLSQEELLKFKDAKIKASIEDLKASNEQYKQDQQTQLARLEGQKEELKLAMEMLNLKASQGLATQEEIQNINILKIAISETEGNIKRLGDLWSRNNLLIDELTQNLGEARTVSLAVETDLNNAVKQFEAEVEAIDNAIDSLNDRKEVLQDEKSVLQDQLDTLNEQKKTIEDTLATYDRVGEAVDELVKAQVDGIQAQIDALEEERKSIEDYYEEQLDALKEQNEERDDAIEKEEALANLANAQNQKKRVYSSDRGWDYEASKADILKAQNELAKIANNEQIKMLENERDAKLAGYDDRKKEYETQIKEYEDYASKYTSISNDIKIAENELLAAQILGSDWREKIEQKDESLLTNYRAQYTSFNEQLNNLTNNEIATLQASIDAKDEEIKKIDDEIAAYNKYKKSVEKSLNDAKTALENYKNSMNDAKVGIISASNEMENSVYNNAVKMQQWMKDTENVTWENHNKIIQWYSEIGDAAEELQKKLRESPTGFGIVNSAWDARLAGYADGGVNTSTGIAMLHGTKQKGEVIFNASDSKKLYDMIHGTPNLLADVVKQANKITGFSPVNNNNSTNSVSVSIGQIVANNPQEFTRGLDVELDKYFRRKLTESYVQ
jgi:TP901 family phage tail tape measure protein